MAADKSRWTVKVVAQRAADLMRLRLKAKMARHKYHESCAHFRARHCDGAYVDTKDPAFRRATRKPYLAWLASLNAERNAMRRLETAVRNCRDCREVN